MMMKKWGLYCALSLAALGLHANEAGDDGWHDSQLFVSASVDVDAQGKVMHLDLLPSSDPKFPPSLDTLAADTIRQWDFVPASLNGAPAPAHTFVHVTFQLRKNGNDYDARVRYVGNGPEIDKTLAPKYPSDMIQGGTQAVLTMLVLVHPDGSLSDIHLESVTSTQKRPINEFLHAATIAIKGWHAEPETVAGHAVTTWVRLPVNFNLRNPINGLRYDPQLEPSIDSPAKPSSAQTGDLALAVDSPLKLRNQSP
ncbi:energy transducer TonB [Dyella sp. 20L07]|uniref:energy transducer TonB n=1 Tax=Dyella sp. 20L07 TaxID=3384240 RepID=UPI003D291AC1